MVPKLLYIYILELQKIFIVCYHKLSLHRTYTKALINERNFDHSDFNLFKHQLVLSFFIFDQCTNIQEIQVD